MDYAGALEYLAGHYDLERNPATRSTRPDISRITELMDVMGEPQRACPVVHVTGTNGKGSTSRIIVELLTSMGLRVGGYASPHLERVNERITVANEPLSDDDFAEAVALVATVEPMLTERWGRTATYFEVMAAAAYAWFAHTAVDVAVVEVGMGGTWDATNVADAAVAVVTNVARDHTDVLGDTLAAIAGEKAGIVKVGSHVVLGRMDEKLRDVFLSRPHEGEMVRGIDFDLTANSLAVGGRSLTLVTPTEKYEDVFLPLHGAHQGNNAATAVAAVESLFGRPTPDEIVRESLARVTAPGRFEIVGRSPLVVLDGAHNPAGAAAASLTLFEDFATTGRKVLVMGLNSPRDPVEMLEAFGASRFDTIVATAPNWSRAVPADVVAESAAAFAPSVVWVPRVAEAVDRAVAEAGDDGVVLVSGSLYVVGEAREHLVTSL
ncbi:MAG TPA: bifunctional folylpolyglutamate synthase/dihydrofolate synthase [Acidimicrobiales bacterium]|nr:bifunctional folylpolyglutamate synthase/dihydrofolate synthase [Acidimicrobiales bacterium]